MRWLVVGGALLITTAVSAEGRWTRAYLRALPDDAFAVVEMRPDGRRLRRLPHHDAEGCVDGPHLRSAWARLSQVRWLHPTQAERARQHLAAHARALSTARPPEALGGEGRGRGVACPDAPWPTRDALSSSGGG